MTIRLPWKIGLIAAAVLGLIGAVLAALPLVVDVEAYKPGMIQAVRDATGRELVIDGPMRLSMFPVPGIGAGTVHFSNAVGAKGAQMIDVRWVAVTPSWRGLLHGRIEVGTLTLYRPTIVLETDANGVPNWQFAPGGAQTAAAPSSGLHLAIGRLAIVQGTMTYTNPRDGSKITAEDVRGGASVQSFDGPFEIDGSATVNSVPLKLHVSVGASAGQGHPTKLSLQVAHGELDFKGMLGAISPDAKVQGHLSVKTGLLSDFVNSIVSATGGTKPSFDTSGAGRFVFDGDIDIAPDRLAAQNFTVSMGADAATGSLALGYKPVPTLDGHLSLSRLDLGKWLTILSRPIDFAPDALKAAAKTAAPAIAKAASAPSIWSGVDADVTVDVAETHYHNDIIHGLSLALDVKKGVIAVPHFKAILPGNMKIEADSATGVFSLSGTDLRQTLKWMDVNTAGIPRGKLQTLKVDGKLSSVPGNLQVSDARFTLDDTSGTAGGTLLLKTPLSTALHAEMDSFDLEAYRPKSSATAAPEASAAAPASASTPVPAATPSPAPSKGVPQNKPQTASQNTPKITLKVKIDHVPYHGEILNGVEGDATLQGNQLQLKNVKVADLLGAKLDMRGSVSDFGTAPRFDLAFNLAAPDADRLLDYAGLPKFINGKIGAVTASGGVAGTSAAVTLRDVAANFLGTDSRVSGTLSFADPVNYDFPTFFLHTKDAGPLVSAASGRAMSAVGYIRATGSLKGTSKNASFTGEIRARGSRMNGQLDTTLDAHPRVVATLKVPGTFKIDRWLGIDPKSAAHIAPVEGASDPTPTPATSQPIDLTALRSFDAKLSVSTDTMTLATIKLDHADIEVALTNGVAKLSKLAGQYYGGAAVFAGTIDASGPALSIDLTGNIRGIAVDQLLRGTLGNNQLSSSGFSVAVGGQVDATGVRITGKGGSSADIRNALVGAGTVSGTLSPVVVQGSPGLARLATSIGGIFSEGLAFDSLILKSFIGRQDPVSGRLGLSAGGMTLENQTVQGLNAVANINGRTSFADDTIDTTIRLDSGSDHYVTTVKGPVAAPVLATTRAPAR